MDKVKIYPAVPDLEGTVDSLNDLDLKRYIAEPKYDGHHLLITNGKTYNKHGKPYTKERIIATAPTSCDFVIDGEYISPIRDSSYKGAFIRVWDILWYEDQGVGGSLVGKSYPDRRLLLEKVIKDIQFNIPDVQMGACFIPMSLSSTQNNFIKTLEELQQDPTVEGIVLKRMDIPMEFNYFDVIKSKYMVRIKWRNFSPSFYKNHQKNLSQKTSVLGY